jgi:hypothetical protein
MNCHQIVPMRAVSAEDVAQVAKQYLHFSAANSVQLIPQGD